MAETIYVAESPAESQIDEAANILVHAFEGGKRAYPFNSGCCINDTIYTSINYRDIRTDGSRWKYGPPKADVQSYGARSGSRRRFICRVRPGGKNGHCWGMVPARHTIYGQASAHSYRADEKPEFDGAGPLFSETQKEAGWNDVMDAVSPKCRKWWKMVSDHHTLHLGCG